MGQRALTLRRGALPHSMVYPQSSSRLTAPSVEEAFELANLMVCLDPEKRFQCLHVMIFMSLRGRGLLFREAPSLANSPVRVIRRVEDGQELAGLGV